MDAVIAMSCSRFISVEMAEEIKAFFDTNPMPGSSRRISQIIENMRANAQFLRNIRESADKLNWSR